MSYIGRGLQSGAFRQLDDISSGFDGSDTTHTMQVNSTNVTVGDVNQILLSLGGVIQKPGTDFTVSASVLTFTTAPAANTSFFAILLGSDNGGTVTPTDGSVTTAKIVDANVTKAKLADSIDVFAGTSLSAADLGVGVHIKTADASVSSLNSAADELVLENSASCGVSILSGTSEVGKIAFGDSGDNNVGEIFYNHSINEMIFTVNTAETLRLGNSMDISTGGEDAPDVTDGGICLDQGPDDLNIMTFKSSDIAHGITDLNETDTFAAFGKNNASEGGLRIRGFGESSEAVLIEGSSNGENTTNGTSGVACVQVDAQKANGTDKTPLTANGNIFGASNDAQLRFIVKGDGEIYSDQSATVGTYDTYEDAQLVRSLELSRGSAMTGLINSQFDKYIKYNHETLAEANLVGREKDGTPNHFVNVTGMQRLHNGAIWQQYEKHQRLAEAVYEMAKEALGEDKADAILKKHDIKLLN
jgi:hypothetical protein